MGLLFLHAQPNQYGITRSLSYKALDSAHLRIVYSLSYISDSLKLNEVWEDRKILLIGDSVRHFYSDYQRCSDSATTAAKGPFRPMTFSGKIKPEGYDMYVFSAEKRRTVFEPVTDLSLYRYQEEIEKVQWNISSDTGTILSYPCKKATACFRGREWEVWFTMDIPLDAGPWKLCGLPGLIMKASDNREHYVFECIGIENISKKKQPVITPQRTYGDFIECTRQEYMKAQRQFYENYVNSLLAMGYNISIIDDSGHRMELIKTPNTKFAERHVMWSMKVNATDRYKKIPYNPIELE